MYFDGLFSRSLGFKLVTNTNSHIRGGVIQFWIRSINNFASYSIVSSSYNNFSSNFLVTVKILISIITVPSKNLRRKQKEKCVPFTEYNGIDSQLYMYSKFRTVICRTRTCYNKSRDNKIIVDTNIHQT